MHNDRHGSIRTADVLSYEFAMYPPENETSALGSDNDPVKGVENGREFIRSQSGEPLSLFLAVGVI
jgi:hypothetical protein